MRYICRILGLILGFRFGGGFGGVFGLWLGYLLDQKLGFGQTNQQEKQKIFYDTTFLVMGHIAKSDGAVSTKEIEQAKVVMQRFNLDEQQTLNAKRLFNHGKSSDFDLEKTLAKFRNMVGARNSLTMMFLEIQISASLADGNIHSSERAILLKICSSIGVPQMLFEQILNMIIAGQNFSQDAHHGYSQHHPNSETQLQHAYQVLGITPTTSDAETKRAYRKLISQHHPDKLQAKGLPDEMLKIAADKTHAIKQAYEIIKEHRNLK